MELHCAINSFHVAAPHTPGKVNVNFPTATKFLYAKNSGSGKAAKVIKTRFKLTFLVLFDFIKTKIVNKENHKIH